MTETQKTPPITRPVPGYGPGPAFPPGRYGHRRGPDRHRRWLVGLLAALVMAAGLGISIKMYRQYGNPAYRAQVLTVTDVSDHGITVNFEVRKPAGEPALCTVRAHAYSGAEVGRAEVPVPAGRPDQTIIEVSYHLATSEAAYTSDVPQCRPAG